MLRAQKVVPSRRRICASKARGAPSGLGARPPTRSIVRIEVEILGSRTKQRLTGWAAEALDERAVDVQEAPFGCRPIESDRQPLPRRVFTYGVRLAGHRPVRLSLIGAAKPRRGGRSSSTCFVSIRSIRPRQEREACPEGPGSRMKSRSALSIASMPLPHDSMLSRRPPSDHASASIRPTRRLRRPGARPAPSTHVHRQGPVGVGLLQDDAHQAVRAEAPTAPGRGEDAAVPAVRLGCPDLESRATKEARLHAQGLHRPRVGRRARHRRRPGGRLRRAGPHSADGVEQLEQVRLRRERAGRPRRRGRHGRLGHEGRRLPVRRRRRLLAGRARRGRPHRSRPGASPPG